MKKRTNATELPEIQELKDIMALEAGREIPEGKKDVHYPEFSTVIKWLNFLKIDTSIFTENDSWENILLKGNHMKEEVVRGTEELRNDPTLVQILQEVKAYLGENDEPEVSDMIFVFGSQSTARISKAIELWKNGMAPIIFISGGHPYYKVTRPEAETLREYALEAGVPEKAIVIEPESITIADNVRRSITLFEEKNIPYKKIILVSSWFVQRRCWGFMKKYTPQNCLLYRVNASVDPHGNFGDESWYFNKAGIEIVFGEFVKMKVAVALNTA